MYPQLVKDGDLLAGLITVLAAQVPTCVLHATDAAWNEPEWTPECRKHLAGLITGIRSVPESFSHTTAPTDLARISLWLTCASAALSIPGGVKDAQGAVLPSNIGGAKSASKYMLRVLQGLRGAITDELMLESINTLSTLLKLWQKTKRSDALGIVRKCKISWSEVLYKGSPTYTIKGKRGKPDQVGIRSPPKPSRSPWLDQSERAAMGELFKTRWSALEGIRNSWNALEAHEQHTNYYEFIRRVTTHYEELNRISTSVHAKLGKRKHWIEATCKTDGYSPKVKKDESQSFLLAAHFFKKDLSTVQPAVKKVFAPSTYLENIISDQDAIYARLAPSDDEDVARYLKANFTKDQHGDAYLLWGTWAELFKPVFRRNEPALPEPKPSGSNNPFVLPGEFPST
jgi:hypothetical protein